MKSSLKKLLYDMSKTNLMFGSMITVILLLLRCFYAAGGFFTGLILYNMSFTLKGYMLDRLLVKKATSKGCIVIIDAGRILMIVLFSLCFKESFAGLLSYCLGISFNFFSIGFAFLRDERGSE